MVKVNAAAVLMVFFLSGCGENSSPSRDLVEDLTGASNVARYERVKSRIGGIDAESRERVRDSE